MIGANHIADGVFVGISDDIIHPFDSLDGIRFCLGITARDHNARCWICTYCMDAFWVTVQVLMMQISEGSFSRARDQSADLNCFAMASDSHWLTLQPRVVIVNFGIFFEILSFR